MGGASGRPAEPLRRVLITTDTVGGVWNYSLELARSLEAFGIQPLLAALGRVSARQHEAITALGRTRLFSLPCRLEWMQDPWPDVERSGRWLLGLAGRLRPDIIHLNTYACAAQEWPAPVLVAGHSCVYSWYRAVRGRPPGPRWHTYYHAVQKGLRAADGVTAPTRHILGLLQAIYPGFAMLPVVPNGRRADDFAPAAKEPFIFSAGRLWDEAKNISALAAVAGDLPWPVVLAGEAQHPEGGTRRLDNVNLLGALAPRELADWYGRASIYALPALYEPFGLSVLEAGLSGCALVLGDIGSLRENWAGAALFVPPRRPALLKQAVVRLTRDRGLLGHYAAKARERALAFSAERMGAGYVRLYRRLLSAAPAAGAGRRPARPGLEGRRAASGRNPIAAE